MQFIKDYQQTVSKAIHEYTFTDKSDPLYEPINYITSQHGKRIRPMMVLMANEMFGGDHQKALKPAIGIEIFHNFTLVHDDIMDAAELRRNKPTVHTLYGLNVGILTGDALLLKSIKFFEDLEPDLYHSCLQVFIRSGLLLCEGQQLDINFQKEKQVSFDDYLKMITYKTGVLSAASFEIGALIAGADSAEAENISAFGKHLGIAFQMMDDYLDVFGKDQQIGKVHAGDIAENKKTVLYILARENATQEELERLDYWYATENQNKDKIQAVEQIFRRTKADERALLLIHKHTDIAKNHLDQIKVDDEKKKPLIELAHFLLKRES
ncbi:polyprenyl synthetase family protein [Candidatus Kaistella beijingensis]|uniref:polyprenyl synthetase family protein n=1 Tax=Candidatus Kaistella beijingensis TaxID=2820270 RepID=UPI001CC71AD2|nr:polyprenyl synthetase family protein [Candidatus Kaistella beijingensis]UBB90973.1 polyprenyl synthetase family protein [Candidatus Kaistella beijingensis]